jgi:Ca-activated chloride channel family protein
MNLIAPQNLAFGVLLGAIVLLYVLRLRRRERVVSSTLWWERSTRDLQANAPWQKLRSSPLLWIQLALLALAVVALARPSATSLARGGQTLAIVLDASASMGASDVAPSRFEAARAEARRLLSGLGGEDKGALILAGARTIVLSPLTADRAALARALAKARPQDGASNVREATLLAASLLRGQKPASVVVLSDGVGSEAAASTASLGNVNVQWVRAGREEGSAESDNVAVTAMDVARPYGAGGRPQVFVSLANFSARQRQVELELKRNGDLIAVRPVSIPPAKTEKGRVAPGTAAEIFDNLSFSDGLFEASFDVSDWLASDNRAFASLEAPRLRQVLLLSRGNDFLERALTLDPNVRLTRGSAGDFARAPAARFDAVVCDDVPLPAGLRGANALVFRSLGEGLPVRGEGASEVARPSVVNWSRRHPVTRGASWADLQIAQSREATALPWGEAIVEGEKAPLIVAGTQRVAKGDRQRRVVWCGFDLRNTDLPLRVAFPIFIVNAVRWLGDANSSPSTSSGARSGAPRAGTPVALPVPDGVSSLDIALPDGRTERVRVDRRPFLWSGALQAGQYEARAGEWRYAFGASVLDPGESDLRPREKLFPTGEAGPGASSRARANRELWGFLALAVLALLALEWWVFHRGT